MKDQFQAIVNNLESFWTQLVQFFPRLLLGTVMFFFGWGIIVLVRRGFVRLLRMSRIDRLLERTGVDELLIRSGFKRTGVEALADILHWFLLFVLSLALLFSLGVTAAQDLLQQAFAFVPSVFFAGFILLFGFVLARLVRTATYSYFTAARISGAGFLSQTVYSIAVIVIVFVALQHLSIGGQVLVAVFEIAFAGLCLAFGLAFGLAGKEWASHVLERMWRQSQ